MQDMSFVICRNISLCKRWSSFDPEIRGETDIMIYGEELHNDPVRSLPRANAPLRTVVMPV